MRLRRLLILAFLLLGCGGASDLPDARPMQMFDAPGPPPPDAPTIDTTAADAGPDAPLVDAATDAP
jgi:hypothetical protein